MKKSLTLAIFIMSLSAIVFHEHPLCAQDSTSEKAHEFFWASGGIGFGSRGIGGAASVTYQNGVQRISLRVTDVSEFAILGPLPNEEDWDYGLLYGRAFDKGSIGGGVSVGLSIARGVRRGKLLSHTNTFFFPEDNYERIEYSTVGVPVEANFIGVILPGFGIGFEAFGDINKEHTFGGILFTLHFGKLK